MITTTTSKEINLSQLDKELGGFGLCMNEENPNEKIIGIADESLLTLAKLVDGITAHIAVFTEPTVAEKLASVGLSIEELKAALGGN
jgi:hypothetical protein